MQTRNKTATLAAFKGVKEERVSNVKREKVVIKAQKVVHSSLPPCTFKYWRMQHVLSTHP